MQPEVERRVPHLAAAIAASHAPYACRRFGQIPGILSRWIGKVENCALLASLKSDLAPSYQLQRPSQVALARFEPDYPLCRLVDEDRNSSVFCGNSANQ